jgi:hypothetical protein
MIDEMLVHIFGEAVFGRIGHSKRSQLIARLGFGVLGAGLAVVGAVYFARLDAAMHAPTRACMVLVFAGLACLSLFNVALARKWRWPALLFAASFVALFALRIGLGA